MIITEYPQTDKTYFAASTWKRFFAYILEFFLQGIFYCPCFFLIVSNGSFLTETYIIPLKIFLYCFGLHFFYEWFLLFFIGGNLGQLIFGLKIINVSEPKKPLGLIQCLIRVLTSYLIFIFSFAIYVPALFRFDRRHIADLIAETQVVQKSPRSEPPTRRILSGFLLTIFFILSGLHSCANNFRKIQIIDSQIHIQRK